MAKGRKTGGGSRAGVPNKVTQSAREAIAKFVDGNAHRLQDWLDRVADGVKEVEVGQDGKERETGVFVVKPDPEKAFVLFQSVVEYHIPKLARTELTGKDGGPINVVAQPSDEAL